MSLKNECENAMVMIDALLLELEALDDYIVENCGNTDLEMETLICSLVDARRELGDIV